MELPKWHSEKNEHDLGLLTPLCTAQKKTKLGKNQPVCFQQYGIKTFWNKYPEIQIHKLIT